MADKTVDLDAALDAFNAIVAAEQAASQEATARRLAEECGVSLAEAVLALQTCQWSVTRARKRLSP